MALKGFVEEARKTNAKMAQLQNQRNNNYDSIIDVSDGKSFPKEELQKIQQNFESQLISNNSQNYAPNKQLNNFNYNKPSTQDYEIIKPIQNTQKNNSQQYSSQKIDARHNNIIASVIKKSVSSGLGNTTWQNCKYQKDCNGTIYCREFMSLCGKEKCNRATR